jgi:hypothetical protein
MAFACRATLRTLASYIVFAILLVSAVAEITFLVKAGVHNTRILDFEAAWFAINCALLMSGIVVRFMD